MGPKTLLSLACAACLVTGAALGITIDRGLLGRSLPAVAQKKREPYAVAYLADRLELDAAQLEKVRAILEAYRPRVTEITKDVRPKLKALHEEIDAELRPILRPEQVAELAAVRREWEEQHPSGDAVKKDERPAGDAGKK
jgi:hypothetical protein